MQLNEIIFAGYAGGDAVSKTTQEGKEAVTFSLCHTVKYKDLEDSTWVYVNVYGNWVNTAQLIKKGDNVIVKGQLKVKKYKNDKGEDKTSVVIFANSLGILTKQSAARDESKQAAAPKAANAGDPWEEIPF